MNTGTCKRACKWPLILEKILVLGRIIGILRNFVESTKFGLIWLSHFLLEQIESQADDNALHFALQCAE